MLYPSEPVLKLKILPGQYYDSETNLHYNYFRDYDPSTGRYIQSDLIGLSGGLNTYLYADTNPIIRTDPTGLLPVFLWRRCNGKEIEICRNYCKEIIGRPFASCRARVGFRKNINTIDYWTLPSGLSCSCQDEEEQCPPEGEEEPNSSSDSSGSESQSAWWVPLIPLVPLLTPWPDPY